MAKKFQEYAFQVIKNIKKKIRSRSRSRDNVVAEEHKKQISF